PAPRPSPPIPSTRFLSRPCVDSAAAARPPAKGSPWPVPWESAPIYARLPVGHSSHYSLLNEPLRCTRAGLLKFLLERTHVQLLGPRARVLSGKEPVGFGDCGRLEQVLVLDRGHSGADGRHVD